MQIVRLDTYLIGFIKSFYSKQVFCTDPFRAEVRLSYYLLPVHKNLGGHNTSIHLIEFLEINKLCNAITKNLTFSTIQKLISINSKF